MRDDILVFADNAAVNGLTSNILQVPAATDPEKTGSLHGYAKNVSGAIFLNVFVTSTIAGTEVVTLQDSADGSTFADTGAVITMPVNADAGSVFSVAIPSNARNYIRIASSGGTSGNITAYLGQKESDAQ